VPDPNGIKQRAIKSALDLVERLQGTAPPPTPPDRRLIRAARDQDITALVRALHDGANPNATDSKGRTALMLAADQHWVEGVELLLDRNADVHLFDRLGYGALGHAEWNGERLKTEFAVRNARIVALLREREAPATRSEARRASNQDRN
jgi:ankyrin repeat protein